MDNVATTGDSIYVGAGVYRQLLKPTITPTVAINVIADCDGYYTGDPGEIQVSGYTTNDTTAPSTADALINCNGKNFWSWTGFTFVGTNNNPGLVTAAVSAHDWTFTGCTFLACATNNRSVVSFAAQAADLTANVTFDRCIFLSSPSTNAVIAYIATQSVTADYDVGLTVSHCLFDQIGGSAVNVSTTGASTGGRAGGGYVKGCTFIHGYTSTVSFGCVRVATAWSYTIPLRLIDCWSVFFDTTALCSVAAALGGNGWEDGNVAANASSAGASAPWFAGSISKYAADAPLAHFGQDQQWGAVWPRRYGEPVAGGPNLGFSPFSDVSVGVFGTAADDSTVGTVAWTNPNNAKVINELAAEAYATCSLGSTASGHYLKLTNLAFSPAIPAGATILGMCIEINRKSSAGATTTFSSVKFFDGVGAAYKSEWVSHVLPNNSSWGTADGQTKFGTSTDGWGASLTPAMLNNSGSGVGIAGINASGATVVASIDGVRMHVYWVDTTNFPHDLTGIQRPCGGGSPNFAAGCYELHNTAVREASVVQAGTYAAKLTGPGSQDIWVPVDAVSHQVSLYLRYDSPYAGSRPSVTMLEGLTPGLAQTITATTGANGAWEQETFTAIAPTTKGVVRLRIQSYDTNGAGIVRFDTAA